MKRLLAAALLDFASLEDLHADLATTFFEDSGLCASAMRASCFLRPLLMPFRGFGLEVRLFFEAPVWTAIRESFTSG